MLVKKLVSHVGTLIEALCIFYLKIPSNKEMNTYYLKYVRKIKLNFKFPPNAEPNPVAQNMRGSKSILFSISKTLLSQNMAKISKNTAKNWEIRMILILGLRP